MPCRWCRWRQDRDGSDRAQVQTGWIRCLLIARVSSKQPEMLIGTITGPRAIQSGVCTEQIWEKQRRKGSDSTQRAVDVDWRLVESGPAWIDTPGGCPGCFGLADWDPRSWCRRLFKNQGKCAQAPRVAGVKSGCRWVLRLVRWKTGQIVGHNAEGTSKASRLTNIRRCVSFFGFLRRSAPL